MEQEVNTGEVITDDSQVSERSVVFRRGSELWILKELKSGRVVSQYSVKTPGSRSKFVYFASLPAPTSTRGTFWQKQTNVLSSLANAGLTSVYSHTVREDGTTVHLHAITQHGIEHLKSRMRHESVICPRETFTSESRLLATFGAENKHGSNESVPQQIEVAKKSSPKSRVKPSKDTSFDKVRLTIELVPSPLWRENLRQWLESEQWQGIRNLILCRHDRQCAICYDRSIRIECHETWEYDDDNCVQRFAGCTALCENCHHIKHIGLAEILDSKGELDFQSIVAHYCRVNECDVETFNIHRSEAMTLWSYRSSLKNWTVDKSRVAELLVEANENPEDVSLLPSQDFYSSWLYAKRAQDDYPVHSERGGKWMVFSKSEEHDRRWKMIRKATIEGKLGGSSKASTAASGGKYSERVICVYTHDGDDYEDVMATRDALRDIGITWVIFWKADQMTREGVYVANGYGNVSRYRA